ncbi:thiamine-binding protein [Fontibacter flavus]|uniref:MTH1187 family thiamine-binding protein n=1 Tax=Fontibacter flavus TaxID=654838 RepID=A0ABV6FXT9_9BACT|nr:thiamine-binding protein [Cyclobacteriaceae bacterium]
MSKSNIINLGIQIVPKSKSLDSYTLVDKAIAVIQQSGIKHVVTPFETVMEGTQEELMGIAQRAQQAVLDGGADEVLVYYRMQIRKNMDVQIEDKIGKYK